MPNSKKKRPTSPFMNATGTKTAVIASEVATTAIISDRKVTSHTTRVRRAKKRPRRFIGTRSPIRLAHCGAAR